MIVKTASVTILCISFFTRIIYGISYRPEVVTSVGTIRGVRATNGNYSMFLGIPFAKVNESNPFGDALEMPKFEKIFEANDDYKPCPQETMDPLFFSLDCLILNIYVPDSVNYNKLPVMVYIFGGIFETGSADRSLLGPKFFMELDVILVIMNHRLGPYGFMCLHTPEVPGNQGIRDQSRAMRWVKKHISPFGGDLDKITLFGSSSGAMSVDYHVLSEEEPMYQQVIIQSGTAFVAPLKGANPRALFDVTENLGLKTTDYIEAIEFLRTFNSTQVIQAWKDTGVYFGPCAEKKIQGVQRMISDNPVNLSAPKAKYLKVMIGLNDDEMLYNFTFGAENFPSYVNFYRDKLHDRFSFLNETLVEAEKIVRNFYMGEEEFTEDVRFDLSDFESDIKFNHNTERTIKQYLESGANTIYYYFFTYVGGRNTLQLPPKPHFRGSYHADELGYMFDFSKKYVKEKPTPEDQLMIDRVVKLWTNFAKFGNPTPEPTDLLPVKWEPITQGSLHYYLNITTDINVGRRPFHHRMAFWDLFYKTYGQYERGLLTVPSW